MAPARQSAEERPAAEAKQNEGTTNLSGRPRQAGSHRLGPCFRSKQRGDRSTELVDISADNLLADERDWRDCYILTDLPKI
jgi:hypothetical protein